MTLTKCGEASEGGGQGMIEGELFAIDLFVFCLFSVVQFSDSVVSDSF